jgi:hypothetical protein
MAANNITSEVTKILTGGGSSALADVSALQARISATLRDAGTDAPAASAAGSAVTALGDAVRQNTDEAAQLKSAFQSQIDSIAENTRALIENTTSKEQSAGTVIGDVAKGIGSTIASGLTLSPIIGGIMKLFGGGGDSSAPPPLVKYAPPASIQLQAGIAGGQLSAIDYSAGGQARAITASSQPSSNITVNVQAIDSRSFLDHSEAIAAAVKKAMLGSNSLNDVVSEL